MTKTDVVQVTIRNPYYTAPPLVPPPPPLPLRAYFVKQEAALRAAGLTNTDAYRFTVAVLNPPDPRTRCR